MDRHITPARADVGLSPSSIEVCKTVPSSLVGNGNCNEWKLRPTLLFLSAGASVDVFPALRTSVRSLWCPNTHSMSSFSKHEAKRAAEAFASENELRLRGELVDGDAEPDRCQYPLYNPPPDFPTGWWVCLAIEQDLGMLKSSLVIGVSKHTGEVRILGEAGDEG